MIVRGRGGCCRHGFRRHAPQPEAHHTSPTDTPYLSNPAPQPSRTTTNNHRTLSAYLEQPQQPQHQQPITQTGPSRIRGPRAHPRAGGRPRLRVHPRGHGGAVACLCLCVFTCCVRWEGRVIVAAKGRPPTDWEDLKKKHCHRPPKSPIHPPIPPHNQTHQQALADMPSQSVDSLLGLSLRAGETNLRVRSHVVLVFVQKRRGGGDISLRHPVPFNHPHPNPSITTHPKKGDGTPRRRLHRPLRPPQAHARAHHARGGQVHRRVGPRPPGCVFGFLVDWLIGGVCAARCGRQHKTYTHVHAPTTPFHHPKNAVTRPPTNTQTRPHTSPKTNENRPGGDPQAHRGDGRECLQPRGAAAGARLPGPEGEVPAPGGRWVCVYLFVCLLLPFRFFWCVVVVCFWGAFCLLLWLFWWMRCGGFGGSGIRFEEEPLLVLFMQPTTNREHIYPAQQTMILPPRTGQLRRGVAGAEGRVRAVSRPHHRHHQVSKKSLYMW